MDHAETELSGRDSTNVAQNMGRWSALVNAAKSLRVAYNAGKLQSGYTGGGTSSRVQLHTVSKRASERASE
jgi:hypothetical protein